MSSLLHLQWEFSRSVAKLIQRANELGYEVSGGEWQRTPEQAKLNAAKGTGITHSLHIECLAIDLKLFKDGVYLTATEDYRPLGTWWKTLGPAYRWGGDFHERPDGGHFSITPDGIRA